ncbi:hypothetical protein DZF95_03940 [Clavibacter michiganensis]|nr:hypothetical protein DZF95_03940 [Clavibacter michiganensis]
MTNQQSEPDDQDAMAWLRRADPASDLTPLPAWQLERLKETAMNAPTCTLPAPARPRTFAFAGAGTLAAAAIVGGIVVAAPGSRAAVTTLAVTPAGGPAAACAPVTAEALATSTLAFRATVTSVTDQVATLEVDDVFTGDVGDTVTIPQGDETQPIDGAAPVFEVGTSYLVSTMGDMVNTCGLTAIDSAALETLYEQAF